MVKVSIIGATGYTGIELLRILSHHPEVKIEQLVSHSKQGQQLADVYPQYQGKVEITLAGYDPERITSELVFTALPHGVAQKVAAQLLAEGRRVIDLSGDYRYQDTGRYETWYGLKHNYPSLARQAVYGLPEFNRKEIKGAELVANPGCYPTASLLALLPLVKQQLIREDSIIIDAKSGITGAGKSLQEELLFNETAGSMKAYGVTDHRHTSEIEEQLTKFSRPGQEVQISFTPHLIPVKRGILATCYANLKAGVSQKEMEEFITDFYRDEPFVQVLTGGLPRTGHLVGTNHCQLGVRVDSRLQRVIVVSAIDNLGKGAAGQAVQNMNILTGFPEETGLDAAAVFP